ncbi:peptide ABC transporter permease [Enemella evansiae]|nr:peptide ABC transporter permease [Enemella evansiae]OYO02222.1 peptide ABC transporter permease [Enemella evansiae]OYO11212.1 peptide ABC transporter permease [Enemella evansiae]
MLGDDHLPEPPQGVLKRQRRGGRFSLYARRFARNRLAVVGLIVFVLLVLLAIFGEYLRPYDYTEPDFTALGLPPDADHWFGTDGVGIDLFAQVVHGLGRSLIIGVTVSLATTVIAAIVGATAAYLGGVAERIILGVIHFLLIIPSFLILALISNSAGGDWKILVVVLTLFGWFLTARVIWSLATSLREREYVLAARFMGVPPMTVVVRHIIPNIGSLLIITFTLGVVNTIQSETALSFIGFGVKLPDVSLGTLLATGATTLVSSPWQFWFPAATVTLITVSMALIADGLRDALDPTSASGGRTR